VWDALTGEEKHVLNGHTNSVNSVAFSSDGSRIVSGSVDKSVRVWDALTGEEKHVLNGHTDSVNSVACSSDGSRIVSGSDDNSVRVWSKLMQDQVSHYTREQIAKPTHGLEFTGWLLSPRGGGYIMFVPPGERLPDDANILTIPHSFIAYVDFTNSRLGPEWDSCYSP
jgi:WD40 repeat protein